MADSGADAAATIANAGTITGAIVTGDLDDGFANAAGAIWNAVGESDFGAGDDRIVNHGAIFMDDATIRLGGYAAAGNAFENHGLIGVSGNDTIDMDNPLPVVNDGIISFLDGATDDTLAIAGDLAGHGTIVLDASAANASADRLHIEGSITGEGAQAIAVHLVDSVVRASAGSIALVQVDGDSDAGDFTLGGVGVAPGGFLSLGFDLHEAGAGMLALGVDVTGLNGSGSLAAAMAPGVASLVGAQVGSLRQRMGVMPEQGATGVSSWLRWYGGSGGVDARHAARIKENARTFEISNRSRIRDSLGSVQRHDGTRPANVTSGRSFFQGGKPAIQPGNAAACLTHFVSSASSSVSSSWMSR